MFYRNMLYDSAISFERFFLMIFWSSCRTPVQGGKQVGPYEWRAAGKELRQRRGVVPGRELEGLLPPRDTHRRRMSVHLIFICLTNVTLFFQISLFGKFCQTRPKLSTARSQLYQGRRPLLISTADSNFYIASNSTFQSISAINYRYGQLSATI